MMRMLANTVLLNLLLIGCLQASEIRHMSFQSQTLGREYVYNIYLPDGYQDSGLEYPVLYLLHGNLGTEQSWVGPGNIQQTTDQLIASETIEPLLIVVPADPKFWWADGPEEQAMTALVKDLREQVENKFRAMDSREGHELGVIYRRLQSQGHYCAFLYQYR